MGPQVLSGWQNCMPAFTTIINNVYLILVPVGILIGSRTDDFAGFAMTFIFYLLFVPAISGVLNKIMYISESFMQINGNVARMDEILNIPEMPETAHPKKPAGDDVVSTVAAFFWSLGLQISATSAGRSSGGARATDAISAAVGFTSPERTF